VDSQLKRIFIDRHSPNKKRRLEEVGLVEMDGPNEVLDVLEDGPLKGALLDSDIIIIDDD
jgi:hypothetical protein